MRWRLLAAFVGVTLVVLLAQDVPLAFFVRSVERDRVIASLQRDAFVLGGAAEDVLSDAASGDDQLTKLESTVQLYEAREGTDVAIADATGTIIAASGEGDQIGDDISDRAEVATALTGTPTAGKINTGKY